MDKRRQIVMEGLIFLAPEDRVWLYGFVLMPNHLHLLWRNQDDGNNIAEAQLLLVSCRYNQRDPVSK